MKYIQLVIKNVCYALFTREQMLFTREYLLFTREYVCKFPFRINNVCPLEVRS